MILLDMAVNIPTVLTATVSILGTIGGGIKAWSVIKSRISAVEFKQANIIIQLNSFISKTEKFMEETDEAREQILESVYQLTTAVKGIDGNNGLSGRVRDVERRMIDTEKEVSEAAGRYQMWESLTNHNEK